MRPEIVLAWHGRGFRLSLGVEESAPTRPTVGGSGRPYADSHDDGGESALRCAENPGELLKLGIDVSQATVAKYMIRDRRPPSKTWRAFLANHVDQIVAADFFVVPTVTYRLLFVLVILAHRRRGVVHVGVTAH